MKNTLTEDRGVWETMIDFTEGGKKEGMKAKDFFNLLEKFESDQKEG